jgi:hypothetical protein
MEESLDAPTKRVQRNHVESAESFGIEHGGQGLVHLAATLQTNQEDLDRVFPDTGCARKSSTRPPSLRQRASLRVFSILTLLECRKTE